MKKLLVMRHAKSSWKNRQLSDYDRPLNGRGKRDAPRVARALLAASECPDLIISSSARRARKTAALVLDEAGFGCPLELTDRLYEASVPEYLQCLREVPSACRCVLVIGHNPTLEQLLLTVTGQAVAMPTAAVARVELQLADWRELDRMSRGDLIDVMRPRELADLAGPPVRPDQRSPDAPPN